MIFVILFILLIGIGLYHQSMKKKAQFYNKISIQNKKDNSSLSYKNNFMDNFISKINLNHDTQYIKHSDMVIKCIRAGIRSTAQQKKWIFTRYISIIPSALAFVYISHIMLNATAAHYVIAAFGGAALGFYYPVIRLESMVHDRKIEIDKVFPDFIDLMIVCVEAGMTAEQAYVKISDDFQQFSLIMTDEVQILSGEITYFLDPKTAYDNFYQRTNSEYIKAFVSVVLQSIQYGTPLAQGIKLLSAELREAQLAEVEKKAAALPSKLTVPMMVFTLPVLFVVILYPGIKQAMDLM